MNAEATQWTKRQIAEKCIEISSHTLLEMGYLFGHGKSNESRLEILLAVIVRAVNCSAAIQRLYSDRPYSEEMNVLLRSLAEMIITAAYLQKAAEDEEVESYRRYDSVMLSKKMLGTEILQFLSRIVYPHGHSYTHVSFSSLSSTIDSFRTGDCDEQALKEEADHALFGTAQALHVFSMFISFLKDEDGYDAHLGVVQNLLNQYSDAPSTICSVQ